MTRSNQHWLQPRMGGQFASVQAVILNQQYQRNAEMRLANEKENPNSDYWMSSAMMYQKVIRNEGHPNHPSLSADYETYQEETEALKQVLDEILRGGK